MKLVGMVITKWAPYLPDRAFRVLIRMAMTALDEPTEKYEPEIFHGGRDLLYSVMRAERHGSVKAIDKAIERAIGELVSMGAIVRLNRPGFGRRASYRLTLFGPIRIDEPLVDNATLPDTSGGALPDTSGTLGDTSGGALPDTSGGSWATPAGGPRNNEEVPQEYLKEQDQDNLVGEVPRVTPARGESETQNSDSKCGDPNCVLGYRYDKTRPKHERNYPCPECHPNVIPLRRPA